VFAVAISTVVFPLIAKHAAAGDWKQLAEAYRKGMRLILVINVPAAVGLTVLAVPIIRLLFERGAFGRQDTAMMVPVLAAYAFGLPFFAFVNLILRAFYARKDTATPVRAALLSFVVNLVLSLVLMAWFGTVGLAIAGNVAVVAQAIYLQRRLAARDEGLRFAHLWSDLGKIVVAGAVMGILVAGGWWAWSRTVPPTYWGDALGLLVLIGAGGGSYAGLLWAMRIEGRQDLAAAWTKLRAKLG
jgi:putative peptidoglycan lipid II flippase